MLINSHTQTDTPLVSFFAELNTAAIEMDLATTPPKIKRANTAFNEEFDVDGCLSECPITRLTANESVPINTTPQSAVLPEYTVEIDLVTPRRSTVYLRNRIIHTSRVVDTYLSAETNLPHHRHMAVLHRVYRHNLRNGMNAIEGWAKVIKGEIEDGDSVDVEMLQRAAGNILDRSQELTRISDEAGQLEHLLHTDNELKVRNLEHILADVVADITTRFDDPELSVSIPPDISLYANDKLRIAFDNLIDNAFRHNGPDTSVTITASETSTGAVTLTITDTGSGLPQMEQQILRSPNTIDQLNHGNGLGLWLIRWILDTHNADISVTTATVAGTTIEITFPKLVQDDCGCPTDNRTE